MHTSAMTISLSASCRNSRSYGVDTHWIKQETGRTADLALILVDPSGERAIAVVEPAPISSDPTETIFQDLITKTRCLFLTMYSFVEFRSRLDAARMKGVQVMIDIEDTPQVGQVPLTEILNSCDIASFNHAGFLAYTGKGTRIRLLSELLANNRVDTIVVTLGKQGVMGVATG